MSDNTKGIDRKKIVTYGGGVQRDEDDEDRKFLNGTDYFVYCFIGTIIFLILSGIVAMICSSKIPDIDTSKYNIHNLFYHFHLFSLYRIKLFQTYISSR